MVINVDPMIFCLPTVKKKSLTLRLTSSYVLFHLVVSHISCNKTVVNFCKKILKLTSRVSPTSASICLCHVVFLTSADSLGYDTPRLHLFAHFSLHSKQLDDVHREPTRNLLCSQINPQNFSLQRPMPYHVQG